MSHSITTYDKAGLKVGNIDIAVTLPESPAFTAHAIAIRSLLQNWRQGTVSSKSRGEVALSGRKPWKQKGTGRARAGDARSGIWRKGGTIFGPQARVRHLSLSKKQRKLALLSIFAEFLTQNKIVSIDTEAFEHPSTKFAIEILRALELNSKKLVLFLSQDDTTMYLSYRNIPNVHVVFFDQPNAFDLTDADYWCFFSKDTNLFKGMAEQWS